MVFVFNGLDHNRLIRQNNKGMVAIEQTMIYKEETLP